MIWRPHCKGNGCNFILSWIHLGYGLAFDVELKPGDHSATVTITATCNPYKFSRTAIAGNDWLWDTFNFETDTIYATPTEVGRL